MVEIDPTISIITIPLTKYIHTGITTLKNKIKSNYVLLTGYRSKIKPNQTVEN